MKKISTICWVLFLVFLPVSEWFKYEQGKRLRATIMIHAAAIKARLEWIEIQHGTPIPPQ